MSRKAGQWFRFLGACMAVGFLVSTVCASLGSTREEMRNQVRMTVDFTVLPVVLPDGSEAPPTVEPDAIEGESTLPPESPQAAVESADSSPAPVPAPEAAPVPDPTPAPKPAPEPTPVAEYAGPGTVKAVDLVEGGNGFTVTVRTDKPMGDVSYMNLDNPRRLVLDLRDKWTLGTRNVIRSKGTVKHIVIGEHPDRLRMVVHFNTPPGNKLAPVFTRKGTSLEIAVPLQ